jgi:hypothetical protein
MLDSFVQPVGVRCEITTKSGWRCKLPAKVRVDGFDCCTAHAKMIKEGRIVVRKRTSAPEPDRDDGGHFCAVCNSRLRLHTDGISGYVHAHPSSWSANPHQAVPVRQRKR